MKMRAMKTYALAASLLVALSGAPEPAPAALSPVLQSLQDGYVAAAAKANPAVVHITTMEEQVIETPEFFFGGPEDLFRQFYGQGFPERPQRYRTEASGSGFIFDPDGYVITNDHVVQGAFEIRVILTGPDGVQKSYPGRLLGTDPYYDIAVVKIEGKGPFPSLALGDSSNLRVGDIVLAIGSPFGLGQTVTSGILSALHQSLEIEGRRYSNLIQTDAAINRGNSGGPLVDLDGDAIGINTAIYSPSGAFAGIGFAIPINEAKDVLKTLVAGKTFHHAWLGVEVTGVDDVIKKRFDLPSTEGALVNSVVPDSPAAKAGLKRGDVIVGFGDEDVTSPDDLARIASAAPVGERVPVRYMRDGKLKTADLRLAARPPAAEEEGQEEEEPQEQPQAPSPTYTWQGVDFSQENGKAVVTEVSSDSNLAGYLQAHDQVQGVNDKTVSGLRELKAALAKADLAQGVVFDIVRDGQPMYVSVQVQK